MPYDFPRRVHRTNQVMDADALSGDAQVAASLSARLDRNNLSSTLSLPPRSDNAGQNSAYYNFHYVGVTADPGFGAPGTYTPPNRAATSTEFVIPNSQAWEVLGSMTLEGIETGMSRLWIHAQIQYIWMGWPASFGGNPWSRDGWLPAHVQFALRVDGSIVMASVTGHETPFARVAQPWRWHSSRTGWGTSSAAAKPGPVTGYDINISGLGPEMMPVRLGVHHAVGPGTHTVEIVVRRLDYGDRRQEVSFGYSAAADDDVICCFSRQLMCAEIPMHPPARSSRSVLDFARVHSQDVITKALLHTAVFEKIRASFNAIQEGGLARGALDRNHLASGVLHVSHGTIAPTSAQALNAQYPGFSTSTIAASAMTGATGWYPLHENVSTTKLEAAGFSVNSRRCVIIVKVNVHIRAVRDPAGTYQSVFGALALGYTYNDGGASSTVIVARTEEFINNFNINVAGAADDHAEEHIDVPLFFLIDHSAADSARTYENFRVYGSVIDPPGQSPVMSWRYGNITVLALRA